MPERPGGLVEVRLDGPVDLRVAEAAERGGRNRVGEDAAGEDPDGRHAVRPGAGVAALADDAVGDVGVGADEVVGLDVLEDERAVGRDAGPDVDLRRRAADRLERLLEGQDEAHRAAGPEGHEGDERLVLGRAACRRSRRPDPGR